MPANEASSEVLMGCSIAEHSQIANNSARPNIRIAADAWFIHTSHYANMDKTDDKNGGPNHLRAWMKFRKVKGADLAEELDVTPGMISDLANSNRALSAKWLRRLAPKLRTTPGMLLDHDPFTLDRDLIEIWVEASLDDKKTLAQIAKAVVKTDDDGDGSKTGTHS